MKRFLLIEFLVIAAIIAGGWLFGARTIRDFSQALIWGGCAVIGFGMISLVGQWGARTDSTYLVARTVTDQKEIDRAHRTFNDISASFGFLFESLILGGIPLIIGLILDWIAS